MKTFPRSGEDLKHNLFSAGQRPLGLCSSCSQGPECTYPTERVKPVLQCEQFALFMPTIRDLPEKQLWNKINGILKPLMQAGPDHHDAGLCRSCERRSSCTYPKPEGGVWHCEDYQ